MAYRDGSLPNITPASPTPPQDNKQVSAHAPASRKVSHCNPNLSVQRRVGTTRRHIDTRLKIILVVTTLEMSIKSLHVSEAELKAANCIFILANNDRGSGWSQGEVSLDT